MFRGKYPHTIDPKGRLSIPAKFRDELAERKVFTLVLTEGDQSIWAFPLDEWERFESRLRQQPQFATQTRHFMRITVGSARDCPVDRAGRTLVPPELREFAGLQREVMIVGQLDRFEIWSRERWSEHHTHDLRRNFDAAAGKLAEFGL